MFITTVAKLFLLFFLMCCVSPFSHWISSSGPDVGASLAASNRYRAFPKIVSLFQLFKSSVMNTARFTFGCVIFKFFIETVTNSLAKSINS